MAQIQRKEVQTQIHCNEVVFYQFFMTKANLLPVVSPRNVKTLELVDGTISWDTTVGSRNLMHFGEGLNSNLLKDGYITYDSLT